MLKLVGMAKMLARYWRMAQDPRTPNSVRAMVYTGLALTAWPKPLRPRWMQGQSLLDDSAVAPGLIALGMLMIPKHVRDQYEAAEAADAEQKKAEGHQQAASAERGEPGREAKSQPSSAAEATR